MKTKKNKKLLLLGWDAADWKIINPLLDAGLLPNLEQMIQQGVIGNLATLDPPYSPHALDIHRHRETTLQTWHTWVY